MPNSDPFHITTPRLYISHLDASNDAHCDLIVDLLANPASTKYHPGGPSIVPDRAASRAFIASSIERMKRTAWGRYLVSIRPPDSNDPVPFSTDNLDLIGVVTMQQFRFTSTVGPKVPDVGFNILPRFHGKGYATEAATHLMKYFREEKGVNVFAGLTLERNEEAKRALKRLGFREWGVRSVVAVVSAESVKDLSVWTIGVEDEGELEGLGL
ncbi:acyl-CoA N-acyltransferase [Phaeosphaeriaceae sp. PMI808]|nr:acyl-CoA N-acyltransferase [Phaeosphaeriaceae sp. PMI808]